MVDEETATENIEIIEEEVLDLGKCIASVTKNGGVKLKCEQNIDKIEIDEQGLAMIKEISELATKTSKSE